MQRQNEANTDFAHHASTGWEFCHGISAGSSARLLHVLGKWVALTVFVLASTSCSEAAPFVCEPGEGFTAACRSCDGEAPLGPNASLEDCMAFGALHACACASLAGSCSNSDLADKAVCLVTDCETRPVCPAPQ